MLWPILNIDPTAQLPCFDWHGKGRVCNHGPNYKFLHGIFQKFKEAHRTCILDGMLEHKTAKLNPDLKKARTYVSLIDAKYEYEELWGEPVESPNDEIMTDSIS